jgi:very-short-patch-repair endonuclease
MATKTPQPIGRSVWALARRQHGVVARSQLLELGVGAAAIRHRLDTGRLHPVHRGVYALGRPELTRHGRWMAAVLSCGRRAVLSHRSAAALWDMVPAEGPRIHLSVLSPADPRRPGLVVHRRRVPGRAHVTRRHGLPVTTPIVTLVDIAPTLERDRLEAAVNEADKRDLVDPDTLRAAIEDLRGWPGVAVLRDALDCRTFTLTDSELERRFVPIARRAGLPPPRTQAWVNGFRVDFHWPELGLVVETDGLRYHRTPAQQVRDRLRDQIHTAAGLTCLRFTRAQVSFDPDHVESTLSSVADRLARSRS